MSDPFDTVRERQQRILDAAAHPEGVSWETVERWEAEHNAALAEIKERLENVTTLALRHQTCAGDLLRMEARTEAAERERDDDGLSVHLLNSLYENLVRDAKRADAAERERDNANIQHLDLLRRAEAAELRVKELEAETFHIAEYKRRAEAAKRERDELREALRGAGHELDQWVFADGNAAHRVERAEEIIATALASGEDKP